MNGNFLDALLLETMFDTWIRSINTKPTTLVDNPDYREWAKGIFVQKLTALMELAR